MGHAADAETLSVHVPNEIARVIAARADAIGISKSKFAALVFEQWRREGFPALDSKVNKSDGTLYKEVMQKLNDEFSREKNDLGRILNTKKAGLRGQIKTDETEAEHAKLITRETARRNRKEPPAA